MRDGKILKEEKLLLIGKTKESFFSELDNLILNLSKGQVKSRISLGICFPGFIEGGILKKAPNLKCMEGVNFGRVLSRSGFMKVAFDNDDKCFALGESVRLGKDNLVGITIGTGVGCGIIIDGKIYRGMGNSGEIGHTIVQPTGRTCTCGNQGCLEEYLSTRALLRKTREVFGRPVDDYELKSLLDKGNRKAVMVSEILGSYLGICLANVSNFLDPEVISLGGGLSKNSYLVKFGVEEMKKNIYCKEPKVVVGKYVSGAVGAAHL